MKLPVDRVNWTIGFLSVGEDIPSCQYVKLTPQQGIDLSDTLAAYADVVQQVAETPAHAHGQDEDREYVYLKLPKATHDSARELRGLPMTNGATPDSGALDDALTRIAYETQFGVPMPKMVKQWPTSDGQLGDQ